MFVRFRNGPCRLQLSVVETRRVDGKVRHEHIASLGSIQMAPSVADRIEFCSRLRERLAKLSNRLNAEDQDKIFGAVHERIAIPTTEELRTLQLENGKANARFCPSVAEVAQGRVEALERGETVQGGLGKPLDFEQVMRAAGWSKADIRHADRLAVLSGAEFAASLDEVATRARVWIVRRFDPFSNNARTGSLYSDRAK